jgi:hypothetical protein
MWVRKKPVLVQAEIAEADGIIETLEGLHYYKKGDAIITGVRGERYPCRRDIFDETYEITADIIEGEELKNMSMPWSEVSEVWKANARVRDDAKRLVSNLPSRPKVTIVAGDILTCGGEETEHYKVIDVKFPKHSTIAKSCNLFYVTLQKVAKL